MFGHWSGAAQDQQQGREEDRYLPHDITSIVPLSGRSSLESNAGATVEQYPNARIRLRNRALVMEEHKPKWKSPGFRDRLFPINGAWCAMPKMPAYHCRKEGFHHDNSQCGLAVIIPMHNRIHGTGQKPLCINCGKVNDQEAVLFTIGKSLIGWYIGSSAVASTYGAAGSLMVLLLWVYYSAQIFLIGAEFTRVYANRHGSTRPEAWERPKGPSSVARRLSYNMPDERQGFATRAPVVSASIPPQRLNRLRGAIDLRHELAPTFFLAFLTWPAWSSVPARPVTLLGSFLDKAGC
jgi:hypothetical protein